jgi:hypothetical protein
MGAKRKKEAREIITKRDFTGLEAWVQKGRGALRTLFSLTFESDELCRWRAIEATGRAAKILGERRIEHVRDFLRRLLWLMNDESGGLGWHAPEVIGEIVFQLPFLIEEYGVLLPHFTSEEPFERGSHQALARIAPLAKDLVSGNEDLFQQALLNRDAYIRVYSLIALGAVGKKPRVSLANDEKPVRLYDFTNGELVVQSVNERFNIFAG